MSYQPQNKNMTTGVITGCIVSADTSTTFNVSSGTIAIEDWSDPLKMRLRLLKYNGVTGQLPDSPLTNTFTVVLLVPSSTDGEAELFLEGNGSTSNITRRNSVALGAPLHPNGDGIIIAFTEDYQVAYGWAQSFLDLNICRRACIEGNIISANGVNLSFDRASGSTTLPFYNAVSDPWEGPSRRSNIAQIEQPFIYQAKQPAGPFVGAVTTFIDPDNYDNDGILTLVANNKWTAQRVYFFGQSDTMTVQYGQQVYNSKADAEIEANADAFVEPANVSAGVWIATIILKKGTTDLSSTDNSIINKTKGL